MKKQSIPEGHGCLTGDCPHEKQSECDKALEDYELPCANFEGCNEMVSGGGYCSVACKMAHEELDDDEA